MPNIRLRGPKLSNNKVTISNEYFLQDGGSQGQKINVMIRLSPHILKQIRYPFTDDLNELEDSKELNISNIPKEPRKLNINTNTNSNEEYDNEEDQDYEAESDDSSLSSLDFHINQELKAYDNESNEHVNKPKNLPDTKQKTVNTNNVSMEVSSIVKKEKVNSTTTEVAMNYKPIPPNITPIIENEFSDLSDSNVDFGIIDKVVFSLKDPLSACKISLPVKSNFCVHFECFDFETFCIFNKIPPGIKTFTKKNLTRKSFEKLAYQKNSKVYSSPIRIVDVNAYGNKRDYSLKESGSSKVPIYNCPFCDTKFLLHDLSISDSFNYFVKSTPKDTEKIELLGLKKYRIIQDSVNYRSKSVQKESEVIILSDEDDFESGNDDNNFDKKNILQRSLHSEEPTQIDSTQEVFNDGLDEELIRLSRSDNIVKSAGGGSGSWDDPFTID